MNLSIDDKPSAVENANAKPRINHDVKLSLKLTLENEHPFSKFLQETKNRGIRDLAIPEIMVEALQRVPEEWWTQKLESYTPLEYRINQALSDPVMREKLSELLQNPAMLN